MTRGTLVFLGLWVVTVVGAVAMVLTMASFLAATDTDQSLTLLLGIIAADVVLLGSMGVLIQRQRPRNRIAWVLVAAGALLVLTFNGFVVGALRYLLIGSDDVMGGIAALVAATTIGPALFLTLGLLPILFPDGHLPGPRWRWPVAIAIVLVLTPSLAGLLQPGPVNADLPDNPLGLDVPAVVALRGLTSLLTLSILVGAALGVAAVATRFRRSRGVEREQMKWLLASIAIIAVTVPISFVDTFLDDTGGFTIIDAVAMASLALLPISVAIAILRYRLYEIDRLVSRTIGWALVTGVLVAVFAGLVVGLQALLVDVTQGQTLAVAASTLFAFALFQPVRRRVQRTVDRRFDRARYDGERTAAAFTDRLRDQVDLRELESDLRRVTDQTVRPTKSGVWIRSVTKPDAQLTP